MLLDYLIKCGSEKVAVQCRENIFSIETLKVHEDYDIKQKKFFFLGFSTYRRKQRSGIERSDESQTNGFIIAGRGKIEERESSVHADEKTVHAKRIVRNFIGRH